MDRSHSQRPSAADPNAASPDAAKTDAPAEAAPPADPPGADLPRTDAPPVEDEHLAQLSEAEFAAIERAHFELLERETTQPVRPYAVDTGPVAAVRAEATDTSPPQHDDDATSASSRAFEPAPFAVPPPAAPTAPGWQHETAPTPFEAEPEPDPAPADVPPAPLSVSALDAPPRYEPHLELPHEPSFDRPLPASPAPRIDDAPHPPPQGDWRDLARRAANVAFLVFAGWFIAVLVLIAVYRFVNPPFSMLMAQRFLGGTAIDKQWVPLARISPNLSRAVIVAEDGRFCSHWGVDLVEAANAIRRASDGYPRGASTITMQVAKNLFLLPAKSYLRKLIEIPLTFAIELAWPKSRILEVYLNIVEWGPGVFGAEAASQAHFGRAAAALSARQAAQLAAVLPNPIVRDAGDPGPRTARKASVIQARAAGAREASACVDRRR